MSHALVTVIMPVYNGEPYLKEAIQSLLDQTFKDFELLIINDASKDSSPETIRSFSDPRIRFVENSVNLNLIATLNKGLELASGSYIARMDQDDYSFPERMATQVAFLNGHPEHVLVGSEAEFMDPSGKPAGRDHAYLDDTTIRQAMLSGNAFFHGSVMFKKAAAMKVGGYGSDAYLVEDYDLWLRLAGVGKVANIPRVLYRWRLTPTGMSLTNAKKQRLAAEALASKAWARYFAQPNVSDIVDSTAPEDDNNLRLRKLAQLDIQLARGYLKRGNRGKALGHVIAALKKSPGFPLFYIYLLMAILPVTWFFSFESVGLERMRSARGY